MCRVLETRWPEVPSVFLYRFEPSTIFFLLRTYRALFFSTRAIGKAITPDVDHKSNWQSIPCNLSSASLSLFFSILFFLFFIISIHLSYKYTHTHTHFFHFPLQSSIIFCFCSPPSEIRIKGVFIYPSKSRFQSGSTYKIMFVFTEAIRKVGYLI